MLEGKRLRLRALEKADMPMVLEWRQTQLAFESFFTHPVLNLDLQEAWYQKQLPDPTQLNFIIHHKESKTDIGMIALTNIDYAAHHCEWGRLLVAHKKFLGNGYGKEAIEIILEYGFQYLNLHRISCTALSTNDRVIKLYKKLGFKIEGQLRKHVFKGGRYIDVVLFGMLNEEYNNWNTL